MLTAKEIRRRYLEFFKERGHTVVASGPLIPPNDPTLLFTNAGMVQFKKCFTGEEDRGYHRATTAQVCLRVSGKHNDLENVGRTARHHTLFEMLGNFSFGDYFKKDAITWAWDFCTKELKLPADKLWVTVYKDDDEAADLWHQIAGLPYERIVRMGKKDNFWTMGDTGPCGPCSEIYIDQGEDMACGPNCGIGKCDCDRFLEIWNLVFTQFEQMPDGTQKPLAKPNIDTGMGLERIAAVCQGKRSNFDCDLFQSIIQYAAQCAGVTYSFSAPDTNDVDTALRVIADHSRAAAFLISGGTLPSNESRGYVLRRLIRRALRFSTLIGVHEPFLYKVVGKVIEIMGDDFPELRENADFIRRVVHQEEVRFSQTLDKGLRLLENEMAECRSKNITEIPGSFCFLLSDTYGFPLDIVTDVAGKQGFTVDVKGFDSLMAEQRARARESQKKVGLLGQSTGPNIFQQLTDDGIESVFTGYSELTSQGRIIALLDSEGVPCEELPQGSKGFVVTNRTPFYGESGGQKGDTGTMTDEENVANVTDTIKPNPALYVHAVEVTKGSLCIDREVTLAVNRERRMAMARNHSATHLLQAALRKVLGSHVKQAGSLVDPDHLRFDFSHIQAMTPDEIAAVEREVNAAILADMPVTTEVMDHDEAMKTGAMALFSEKYGAKVRVVTMGGDDGVFSRELCGGTHLSRTGQAGSFYITSESGVAAGVRRIEAVTGMKAYELACAERARITELAHLLKARPEQLEERVEGMAAKTKKLEKASEKASAASVSGADIASSAETVGSVRFACARLEGVSIKAMRSLMDDIRSRMPSGVAALFSEEGGKANIIVYVSKDLHDRFTAPSLIKQVAPLCGGSGGGRPDMAQAGGTNPAGIGEAMARLKELLA